jgi:hypothetical protein
MSEILVIVPPEWVHQDMDQIGQMTGFPFSYMQDIQGQIPTDLNDRLDAAGYFTSELRVADVLVINEQVYFRFA